MKSVLYKGLIWSAKNFALQPSWRVFVLLKDSNKADTKQDIYLKVVILVQHGECENSENKMPVKITGFTV